MVRQIRRLRDKLGAGRINMNMKIGTMPDEVVMRGMELFRDRVLPHVRDL